jgi:methylthioribose-1-phosphate isomerase
MNPQIRKFLPTLVRPESIARYEDGKVLIGDRRDYPFEYPWYECESVEDVAQAIEKMVTQGAGPRFAAGYGFALAARDASGMKADCALEHLEKVEQRLVATRRTNPSTARLLSRLMCVARSAAREGISLEQAILKEMDAYSNESLARAEKMARFGATLINDGDGILTMCFAEDPFLLCVAIAYHLEGKRIRVYTPETRPYLQGARLTAPSIREMSVPVTLITDGMPASLMSQGKIQKFMTGSDLVTLDGHVVNKVGTYQNAVNAYHHGIPYFPFSRKFDCNRPNRASIEMEERDPREVREFRGVASSLPEIDAYYPAFDITPPHLVSGVVTERGIISPYDLARFYGAESGDER